MKKSLFAAVLGLSLFATAASSAVITSDTDAALAGATLETFDGVASGEYASLTLGGVTIVGNGSTMTVDSSWTGLYGIAGQTLHNSASRPYSFDLIFDTAVSAFGIWGGAYNNNWLFSAYDAADNLIESAVISTSCCRPQFNGLANAGMTRVTLEGYGDWVIFDNLMYVAGTSDVPEPAPFVLLSLGLAALGFSRKFSAR